MEPQPLLRYIAERREFSSNSRILSHVKRLLPTEFRPEYERMHVTRVLTNHFMRRPLIVLVIP